MTLIDTNSYFTSVATWQCFVWGARLEMAPPSYVRLLAPWQWGCFEVTVAQRRRSTARSAVGKQLGGLGAL